MLGASDGLGATALNAKGRVLLAAVVWFQCSTANETTDTAHATRIHHLLWHGCITCQRLHGACAIGMQISHSSAGNDGLSELYPSSMGDLTTLLRGFTVSRSPRGLRLHHLQQPHA
jgi:hypothetical protein